MTMMAHAAEGPAGVRPEWHRKFVLWLKRNTGLVILWLIRRLNWADLRLTAHMVNPNGMGLEDLGPTANAERNGSYEQSLHWALRNPNVTNIALTGPYGSGKSSVIATFQARYKIYSYLNISLATFDKEFKKDDEWRQKVELSILQQLIYHVKNSDLPDSRFRKISYTGKPEKVTVTLLLVLFGISFFNIYQPEFITKFSWWQHLDKGAKDWVNYLSLGFFLLGLSTIIYKFYRTLKGFRFSKLGLTNGQVELSDKEDRSVFNKHLDEIIYFFQVTPFDVIVIEDLDRFEDAEIFTKLREVNNLINNSRQVGRPVNFLYAVRDDMFKDTDRAKFFDLIIPVIPVINTSNAGDELNRKLGLTGLDGRVHDSFFNNITLYIQDMRLLINIINEFRIYLTQIGKGLDPEKLLAIVVYKNLYPDEFAKLHKQDGDAYHFIGTKKTFIAEHSLIMDREIAEAETIIEELGKVKLLDLRELRSVYITAIFAELPNNSVLKMNGRELSIADLLKEENFDRLTLQNSFTYLVYRNTSYNLVTEGLQRSFAQIERSVHSDSYQIRKEKLTAVTENQIRTQQSLIRDRQRKRSELSGYTIRQVMNSFPEFTLPSAFADKPLLSFLIGEGYIDEHYPMYISYFIEGSLSQSDMDFVQSINQRRSLGFGHALNNIGVIVTKWLSIGNYAQPEILNILFFDWILQADDREAEPRNLFEQLAAGDTRSMDFIREYTEKGREITQFFQRLAMHFPGFWDNIFDDGILDDSVRSRYLSLILEHVTPELVLNFNVSDKLSAYIGGIEDYPAVFERISNKQNIMMALSGLDVKFAHLPQAAADDGIAAYIYRNNHYKLSPDNLQVIFNACCELFETPAELTEGQYTAIKRSRADWLLSYIQSDMNTYAEDVLLKLPANTKESEQTVTELLGNGLIRDAVKEQLIIRQEVILPSLITTDRTYWDWLLKYGKVKLNWNNLLAYYDVFGEVTETLVIFLNMEHPDKLVNAAWLELSKAEDTRTNAAQLENALLNEPRLSPERYREIAEQAHYAYDDLFLEKLGETKNAILIESGTLKFNAQSLALVDAHAPSMIWSFILNNEEEYPKLDWPLTADHYKRLISLLGTDSDKKFAYLKALTKEELNPQLAYELGQFLSSNTGGINNFSMEFRVALLAAQPSLADTADLLQPLGRHLTVEGLLQLVSLLPEPYNKLSFIHRSPMFFEVSDVNDKLLNYLDLHLPSVISSVRYDEKKDRLRVNFRKDKG